MEERRKFSREQADWLAEIHVDDTIYTAPVRNLSIGGIEVIRTLLWRPKPDQTCRVSLTDMHPDHTLDVQMQVCWVTERYVGLKYLELKDEERMILNEILAN